MRRLLLAGAGLEVLLLVLATASAGLLARAGPARDPEAVVRSFELAINAGDAAQAVALLSSDAFLLVDGAGLDRAEAGEWLRSQVARRARFRGRDYRVDGPLVGWTTELWRQDLGGTPRALPMVAAVREGRIRKWFLGVRGLTLGPAEPEAAFASGELPRDLWVRGREADSQEILLSRLAAD